MPWKERGDVTVFPPTHQRHIDAALEAALKVPRHPLHGLGQASTHYACPDLRGYWGDYFGITQFQRVGYSLNPGQAGTVKDPWLNASTFSVSSFKPVTTASSCAAATKMYSDPVDIEGYTWPSFTFVFAPY